MNDDSPPGAAVQDPPAAGPAAPKVNPYARFRGWLRSLPALVRRALYVGLVLVLALSLSVVGSIVQKQRAEALVPVAAAAPLLVISGPAGWAAAGLGLAVVGGLAAVNYGMGPDENGKIRWGDDIWAALFPNNGMHERAQQKAENEKADAETSPPATDGTAAMKPLPVRLDTMTHRKNGELWERYSMYYFATLDPWSYGSYTYIWANERITCRTADGQVAITNSVRQIAFLAPAPNNSREGTTRCPEVSGGSGSDVIAVDWAPVSYDDFTDAGHTVGTRNYSVDRGAHFVSPLPQKSTTGYRTTVECLDDQGSTVTISADASRSSGGPEVPNCKAAGLQPKPDGTTSVVGIDDGGRQTTAPLVEVAPQPGTTAPLGVAVDGQDCTMGRADCANWTNVRQAAPERVTCTRGGVAVDSSWCNQLEGFYKNGGTPHIPENTDGDPGTWIDPKDLTGWVPHFPSPEDSTILLPAPGWAPTQPYPSPTSPDEQPWDPSDPIYDPDYDPRKDPSSPDYDPRYDPMAPEYDPRLDPSSPDYDPYRDPSSPLYDPRLDPYSPDYDPYFDPDSPLYDPNYDPDAPAEPEPEPEPSPTSPEQPEPSPTAPASPEPEPTTPAEPDPEPTTEPEPEPTEGTGEDPDPEPEPSQEPTVEPTLQPQPGEAEPPVPPLPTAVDVDEDGHLLPVHPGLVSTATSVLPDGSIKYANPDTGLNTVRAPDGTKVTTEPTTGTRTVLAPDGTRTTTRTGVPTITSPPRLGQIPVTKNPRPPVPAPPTTCVVGSTDPRCYDDDDDDDEENCMSDSWDFNPVDFVYEPVTCALFYAFDPEDEVLDYAKKKMSEDVQGTDIHLAGQKFRSELEEVIPAGSSSCAGPVLDFEFRGIVNEEFHPFSACGPMAPVADVSRAVTSLGVVLAGGWAIVRNLMRGFDYQAPELSTEVKA